MVTTQEFTFPSSDGVHLVGATWWKGETERPRAIVQLVHGISEYIGRYDDFARFLAECGYWVVGHDHLGHGRTATDPSEYGWFADKDGWKYVLKDTRTLRRLAGEACPEAPYFIMGHSMGSFVVRGYLSYWPGTVDGAILSGTGQEAPAKVNAGLALSGLLMGACNALELGPIDQYSINNYWNTEEQCERFMIGLHYRLKEKMETIMVMGELRV